MSSYRLAYRYVASSANNNNNDNVDVNNDNDKPVVLFCNGFRSASNSVSGGGTKVNAVEEYCKIKSTTSTSVASIIVDMVYRQEILMI